MSQVFEERFAMDHDRLFKELLATFFVEFLELFFSDFVRDLDRNSIEFFDKQVFTDVTVGRTNCVTIDEVLALNAAIRNHESVTIEGRLVATRFFSYIASDLESDRGVLIYADPPIIARLLQCAPASGGSHVIFFEPCVVCGNIAPCILPMFPAFVYGLTQFVYDGRRLVCNADRYTLDPPYEDHE
jgi:hypothetical protein